MAVTSFFLEAAQGNNVRRVRDMMADSLIRDPLFEEFDEMLGEMGKFSLDPDEPHDGKPFNQDSTAWDKPYLDNLMRDLRLNFSPERVDHVKSVCRYIYSEKIEAIQAERRCKAIVRSKSQPEQTTASNSLCFMLIAGAVMALLIIGYIWLFSTSQKGTPTQTDTDKGINTVVSEEPSLH